MTAEIAKINAAAAALDFVKDGMQLGLGTGSTAAHFVRLLGERVKKGLDVRGVPTSEATERLAREVGVPLMPVDRVGALDLCIDGADEIDPEFRLIKGGGAALLREKIIASAARHFIVIADDSKMVETLGAFPLPVEVTPFGFTLTAQRIYGALKETGCTGRDAALRERDGKPVVTDGGNYIIDCMCGAIPKPEALADALKRITGVVEHGLFLGMARTIVIGGPKGAEVRER
jgi:ribose 5-phosphate isomerase A